MRKKETLYLIPAKVLEDYAFAYYFLDAMKEAKLLKPMDATFIHEYINKHFPKYDYHTIDDIVKYEDMLGWKSVNAKECYEKPIKGDN